VPATTHTNPAAAVIGGKLYLAGGVGSGNILSGVLEVYDPATNAWTTKAPMLTPRDRAGGAAINGLFYVTGGAGSSDNRTVEVYDPASNSWATKAPLLTGRSDLAAGVVGGKLYAVGGYNGVTLLGNSEAYTP
jgi:N-acetylneuraminic acid mutarotase